MQKHGIWIALNVKRMERTSMGMNAKNAAVMAISWAGVSAQNAVIRLNAINK